MRDPVNEGPIGSAIKKGAAAGAAVIGRALGSKAAGATTANAMGSLSNGATVGKNMLGAVAPYAEIIGEILADPRYRALFMKLINTIKADKARMQAKQAAQPKQESTTMNNTNEARRLSPQVMDARDELLMLIDNMLEVLFLAKLPNPKKIQAALMDLQMQLDEGLNESDDAPTDQVDTVTLDIPLMIRMLEFAKEDAADDMALHDVAEKLITLSKETDVLTMDQYDSIVGTEGEPEPGAIEPVTEGLAYGYTQPESPANKQNVSYHASAQVGDSTVNLNIETADIEELTRLIKLAGLDKLQNAEAECAVQSDAYMPGPELEFRVEKAMAEAQEDGADDADFYVTVRNDGTTWVGQVARQGDGRWFERLVAGAAPRNWGRTYQANMSVDDIMGWMKHDYEYAEGPFAHEDQARATILGKVSAQDREQAPELDFRHAHEDLKYSTDVNKIAEQLKHKMGKTLK